MNLRAHRKVILKILLTSITFILTVLLPIIGYFQFSRILTEHSLCSQCQLNFEDLQVRYIAVFISLPIVGIILTVLRYSIYRYPRYSVQQGYLNLLSSIFFIVFLSILSQLGVIVFTLGNFSFNLNMTDVFFIIIAVWSLFIVKNIVDLIDFKKNRTYYENLVRIKK